MPFQVIHGNQRQAAGEGQSFGEIDADKQTAGQARSVGDGDGVQLAHMRDRGIGQRVLDDSLNCENVLAAGDLRVDAAETPVELDLAGDPVAEDMAAVGHDRGRGLVATGFDSEDAACRRAACVLPSSFVFAQGGRPRAAQSKTIRPTMASPISATSL